MSADNNECNVNVDILLMRISKGRKGGGEGGCGWGIELMCQRERNDNDMKKESQK